MGYAPGMPFRAFPYYAILSLVIVMATATIVWQLSARLEAGIVALVGGAGAVLLAFVSGVEDAPVPLPADSKRIALPPPPPEIDRVLDAIVEPVLLVREGRVDLANRAALKLLGQHVIGEDVRTAIRHPAAAERLTASHIALDALPIDLIGLGMLDQRWEMRVALASDDTRVVHLIDQTGNYAAERMRVDFVANASHELRTPLSSILGYVETLGDAAGEDPLTRARFLKVVLDEARRMQRLVDDLMSLSRIEAEKYRLPAVSIDLSLLVDEVRAELESSHGQREHDVVTRVDRGLPPVSGDRSQLSQMLHNLVGNAMKYGREGTPITVALERDMAGMVRLTIADEGEGIAPEHLPRLTERFYRVDPGRSRSLGGTGLGLAIVKHIVERHRGRLDIASVVGSGTRVTVTLPPSGNAVMKT